MSPKWQLISLVQIRELTQTLRRQVKPMPLEISFQTPLDVDVERKYKISTLMLERKGSIPVFFDIGLKKILSKIQS